MNWLNINAKVGEEIRAFSVNLDRVLYAIKQPNIVPFYFSKEESLPFGKKGSAKLILDDAEMQSLFNKLRTRHIVV